MRRFLGMISAAVALWHACACAAAPATQPAAGRAKAYVAVFDFHTEGASDTGDKSSPLSQRPTGVQLADSVRLRLGRHEEYQVIDRLTTADFSGPLPLSTDVRKVTRLMTDSLAANLGLYGTVSTKGQSVRAEIRCIDLTDPRKPAVWTKSFSDDTERARGVIATAIVEAVRGKAEWAPPQYGDEKEPENFGKPLNRNGDFEAGSDGWENPDNVSTFIVDGPAGRGRILKVRTDLARDAWLEYTRRRRLGKADPANPPSIPRDTGYSSVAGLEGVHYRGELIKAKPGRRYWLVADHMGGGGAKVFVKGFRRTQDALDGLPESALAELGLTPEQFAAMPAQKRRELIAADAEKNPDRYLRECYRWYLNCKDSGGKWKHFAAPFPPRGGLPNYVEFLQIQVYSYWPAGIYLWDKVYLYEDPNQQAPLPEEKPRTPNAPGRDAESENSGTTTRPGAMAGVLSRHANRANTMAANNGRHATPPPDRGANRDDLRAAAQPDNTG